jgi:outer membrane protein assembly factor BamE (lipoprotein component of BamABCDE complex)
VPTDEELATLTVGKDTRETVAQSVGRPSAQGLLNDEAWYYVQSRWQQQGLARRTEIDRQVVAISFNEAGTVTNIERFGLEDGQVVALSRRVTQENVQGRSALAQIFANFGRLDVGQILADQ